MLCNEENKKNLKNVLNKSIEAEGINLLNESKDVQNIFSEICNVYLKEKYSLIYESKKNLINFIVDIIFEDKKNKDLPKNLVKEISNFISFYNIKGLYKSLGLNNVVLIYNYLLNGLLIDEQGNFKLSFDDINKKSFLKDNVFFDLEENNKKFKVDFWNNLEEKISELNLNEEEKKDIIIRNKEQIKAFIRKFLISKGDGLLEDLKIIYISKIFEEGNIDLINKNKNIFKDLLENLNDSDFKYLNKELISNHHDNDKIRTFMYNLMNENCEKTFSKIFSFYFVSHISTKDRFKLFEELNNNYRQEVIFIINSVYFNDFKEYVQKYVSGYDYDNIIVAIKEIEINNNLNKLLNNSNITNQIKVTDNNVKNFIFNLKEIKSFMGMFFYQMENICFTGSTVVISFNNDNICVAVNHNLANEMSNEDVAYLLLKNIANYKNIKDAFKNNVESDFREYFLSLELLKNKKKNCSKDLIKPKI